MATAKLTADEADLYELVKSARVKAVYKSSGKGSGWIPVCRGRVIKSVFWGSQSAAAKFGQSVADALIKRAENQLHLIAANAMGSKSKGAARC